MSNIEYYDTQYPAEMRGLLIILLCCNQIRPKIEVQKLVNIIKY